MYNCEICVSDWFVGAYNYRELSPPCYETTLGGSPPRSHRVGYKKVVNVKSFWLFSQIGRLKVGLELTEMRRAITRAGLYWKSDFRFWLNSGERLLVILVCGLWAIMVSGLGGGYSGSMSIYYNDRLCWCGEEGEWHLTNGKVTLWRCMRFWWMANSCTGGVDSGWTWAMEWGYRYGPTSIRNRKKSEISILWKWSI
jgi:hypothetical protein